VRPAEGWWRTGAEAKSGRGAGELGVPTDDREIGRVGDRGQLGNWATGRLGRAPNGSGAEAKRRAGAVRTSDLGRWTSDLER
jgi:hypothetical protein